MMLKSSSDEQSDIEEVIDSLINDVCMLENRNRKIKKFVKVLVNQKLLNIILNIVYHFFTSLNILKYRKIIRVKAIYCIIDRELYKINSDNVKVFDNGFEINKKIKIPYEYLKIITNENKYININLIPNERNITKILVETYNNHYMFQKICSNMNYHVRYHSLNNSAIKYYQKFHKTPMKVFL